jgi:hypothetical protein
MLAILCEDIVRHRHDLLGADDEARFLERLALGALQRRLAEFEVAPWELPMAFFYIR